MIKLQVSDFGPIVEGTVDLKSLTIFVGPNNSGKSYFAVLAYALFRSLSPFHGVPRLWGWGRRGRFRPQAHLPGLVEVSLAELFEDKQVLKALQELRKIGDKSRGGEISISFGELPEKVKQVLQKALQSSMGDCTTVFGEELKRSYASELLELTRKTSKRGFTISISQDDPPLRFNMSYTDDSLKLADSQFDVSNQSLHLRVPPPTLLRRGTLTERDQFFLYDLLSNFLIKTYREFLVDPYYFPAARSGILQSHKALASYVVSRSPLAGIEDLPEIPRLPGVVADFISKLLTLEKDSQTELYNLARFLESQVTKGTIDIEAGKLEYPEIYYEPATGKFPLHRTSSMVSELAPMVLFLKYLIDPGDFVIIEEPESHLHPESQRKLARGIVKLIRAGVKVLITTHSDDFVQQLSNFIRLSRVPEEQRVKRGYSAKDYLNSEEVGAYLFELDPERGGSFVKELAINARDGIPEEEFARVTEALYKETVYLHRAVSR